MKASFPASHLANERRLLSENHGLENGAFPQSRRYSYLGAKPRYVPSALTMSPFISVRLALRLTPVCSPDVRHLTTCVGVYKFSRNIFRNIQSFINTAALYHTIGSRQDVSM